MALPRLFAGRRRALLLRLLANGLCQALLGFAVAWLVRDVMRGGTAASPAAHVAGLLLAGLALLALRAGLEAGVFTAPDSVNAARMVAGTGAGWSAVGQLLSMLLTLNVILLLFNLIPIPPLDGATAIGLVLPASSVLRWKRQMSSGGLVSWGGLIFAWILFPRLFRPVWGLLLSLVHPDLTYG